jgi:hypothetical protein
MSSTDALTRSALIRDQALAALRPLVVWMVRSGVGYAECAAALKPLFLDAARTEMQAEQVRVTDSALSLRSGLHRKDVRLLGQTALPANGSAKATPANQVVTRWLARGLPDTLCLTTQPIAAQAADVPAAGEAQTAEAQEAATPSFEQLVQSVTKDLHPRALLDELVRLGVVREAQGQVSLSRQAFVPDAHSLEAAQMLSQSVADHVAAGVHNLSGPPGRTFLEQSVFADGLTDASIRVLEQQANALWREVLATMVAQAQPLCDQDEALGGTRRLRLGMYCFSAEMEQPQDAGREAHP